jgi:hypothetical protein
MQQVEMQVVILVALEVPEAAVVVAVALVLAALVEQEQFLFITKEK